VLTQVPVDIKLDPNIQYMTFNNYIDSGFYRVSHKDYKNLAAFAKTLARDKGLSINHIGTQREKDGDKTPCPQTDLDLRGKTTPADLFYIAGCKNVVCNVSFDTFLMHVFFICGKKSYVLFRGRYTRNAHDFIVNCVLPPFKPEGKREELIEFIR
jgi:hypothetical protein